MALLGGGLRLRLEGRARSTGRQTAMELTPENKARFDEIVSATR